MKQVKLQNPKERLVSQTPFESELFLPSSLQKTSQMYDLLQKIKKRNTSHFYKNDRKGEPFSFTPVDSLFTDNGQKASNWKKTESLLQSRNPASDLSNFNSPHFSSRKMKSFEKRPELQQDLSLYLSLSQKPLNLLFSTDQFFFELSKKTSTKKANTEFFQQLKERKKLSLFYGSFSRKSLTTLFEKAKTQKGFFGKNLLVSLERRLDVIVYRCHLAKTIAEARQLIQHHKIQVNHHFVTRPGFLLTPGDLVSKMSVSKLDPNLWVSGDRGGVKSHHFSQKKIYISENAREFFHTFQKNLSLQKKSASSSFWNSPDHLDPLKSTKVCRQLLHVFCRQMKSRAFLCLSQIFQYSATKGEGLKKSHLILIKWKVSHIPGGLSFRPRHSRKSPWSTKGIPGAKDEYPVLGQLTETPCFWPAKQRTFSMLFGAFRNFLFLPIDKKWREKKQSLQQKTMKGALKTDLKKRISLASQIKARSWELLFLLSLYNSQKFETVIKHSLNKMIFQSSHASLQNQGLGRQYTNGFQRPSMGILFPSQTRALKTGNLPFWKPGKPLNLEISYKLMQSIYLYSPQRLHFPFLIDMDLISRSLR